ncbi:hydroxyectoine utilization dehydratase EutB [Ammoniphilus sp. YIM 78166]|uniref:hydroxyectoine utilization dehydratase EutB n=1 Tax=Ammoniphilus sp. YIM 78166 TaxID=1644106 RepID=UPI0010704805|nr:hydroxyectoine utilization dehydratase EutB [Ammoniphilus sp. YIM 78166]
MNQFTPTLRDVWKARKRIAPIVKKTPLIFSHKLSEMAQASVYLKLENMHDIGAFKVRGAANKILSLTPQEQKRGVTTFSTGNHGQAVAYVAQKLGIPAVVCISKRVPKAKVDAIRRWGAELAIVGESQDAAGEHCFHLQEEEGLTVIPPFDDPHIIAGQGTMGLEILEELPEVDLVIGGLSGGGLHAGVGLALKSNDPAIQVIGVSMEHGAVMHESLKAGRPVVMEERDTLADSLLGGIGLNNQYTFPMVRQYVDHSILIPEETIAEGMAYMLEAHRMVVEGAAAVGIGALLKRNVAKPGGHIAVIISGCNVNTDTHLRATQPYVGKF